jgi:KDO2-lipid IV(A) lauroyltransferase
MFVFADIDIHAFRRKTVLIMLLPFLYATIFIFRWLPIKVVRRFARFSGKQFYRFAENSRERALANLEMIYGDKMTEKERIDFAKSVFIEVIMSFFDYIAYSNVAKPDKYFSFIEVTGEMYLKQAYERGKGVICLIPHLSSWEFAAITPPMMGYETSAASKSMKLNALEHLVVKMRGKRGMKNITREGSYAKLVDVLKKGECLILMIDQDTKVKSVFVDFIGKQAYTPLGVSRLALDTEAAIVPMAMTRKEDGNYRFLIYPELPVVRTGNIDADLLENTQIQTKKLEEIILEYSSQWVWMHRRWKTTPEKLEAYKKAKKEAKEKTVS